MVKNFYSSNLCETLKKAGLYFLIPESPTSYDDDEGLGHMSKDRTYELDDWEMEEYFSDDLDAIEAIREEHEKDFTERINNLDELMLYFDEDVMEPEEFIELNAWDLFGLTLNQFKRIQVQFLNLLNCGKFCACLKRSTDLSVEQRIKWATCCAVTDCDRFIVQEGIDWCKHISNLYDEQKAIELIRLYCDYLRFIPNAQKINERRIANGEEPINYPINPRPSHIKDLHDKAFRDFQVIETERAKADEECLNEGIREAGENPAYQKFLYSNGIFELRAPKSYHDFEHEGDVLNHCIASYADAFSRMETFIYFLRECSNPTMPYYSIELLPGDHGEYFLLNQCYTYNDSTEKTPQCRAFIQEWCKKFKIKINCEI